MHFFTVFNVFNVLALLFFWRKTRFWRVYCVN